jgi:hypothetical protein
LKLILGKGLQVGLVTGAEVDDTVADLRGVEERRRGRSEPGRILSRRTTRLLFLIVIGAAALAWRGCVAVAFTFAFALTRETTTMTFKFLLLQADAFLLLEFSVLRLEQKQVSGSTINVDTTKTVL